MTGLSTVMALLTSQQKRMKIKQVLRQDFVMMFKILYIWSYGEDKNELRKLAKRGFVVIKIKIK